jgi:hypothetical protein
MAGKFRGTTKRITTSFLMLLSGIAYVLIGLAIIYLVFVHWMETAHILEVIGALFVSLWVLGSGGLLIHRAIGEAGTSGKDE